MRGMVPVVMAGILGIYGLIIAVIVSSNVKQDNYPLGKGLVHLGAGVAGGMASLAAGFAIGVVGDTCATAYQRTEVCPTFDVFFHTHRPFTKPIT